MNIWKNATTADLLHKARCAEPTLAIRQELQRRGIDVPRLICDETGSPHRYFGFMHEARCLDCNALEGTEFPR